MALHGDLALTTAERGHRRGNLVYRKAARNFGPVMATPVRRTVATVHEGVGLGVLDPETVVIPGIHVTDLLTRQGQSKVVEACSDLLNGIGCVKRIHTDRCARTATRRGWC